MEKLGKYKIEAKLGEGAMGFVYKAWHPGFNDYVALKTIQSSSGGEQLTEWFKFEARTLAKLKHPNIVQIYEVEENQGINFIVMEYLNGGSLDRLIDRHEDVPLAKRVGFMVSVCHALDHAHRRRVFHRDIKPANIMLHYDGEDEVVKVVDFGIARLVDFAKTQSNWQLGAPAYMAPELLTASATANEKTDIWAAGVTLYELLANQRPFRGETLEELKRNVVNAQPLPLRQLCSECPADLEGIVSRMLEKSPEQRYPSVEEVLLELEPVQKRLCKETANTFVRRAQELYEVDDFDAARTTAKKALQYDSTNTQARGLIQQAQQEIRRRELTPKLQEHLKKATDYLQSGQIEKARGEVNAALGLDSRFGPILKIRDEIEQAAARAQLLDQKLKATKQRLSEGSLTQADALLKEAEQLDELHPQVRDLRRQLEDERHRRERRKRMNLQLNRARTALAEGDFEMCLRILEEGQKEYPTEAEFRKLQDIAKTELAELERQKARDKTITEVRKLIASDQFREALVSIQPLLEANPKDVVVRNLETLATDGLREQEKRARLQQGMTEIRSLIGREDFAQAAANAEAMLKEFPREYELRELLDFAMNEQLQLESKRRQSDKEAQILQLLKAEAYKQAEELAAAAMDEFPRSLRFRELYEEAGRERRRGEDRKRREQEERQRAVQVEQEELNRTIASVRTTLAAGNAMEAERLLENAIRAKRVSEADVSVVQLRAEIAEKKRQGTLAQWEKQQKLDGLFDRAQFHLDQRDFGEATRILEEIRGADNSGLDAQRTLHLASEIESRKREAELGRDEERRKREEQRAAHDRCVNDIRSLLGKGRIDDAEKLLSRAVEQKVVDDQDFRRLRKQVDDARKILLVKNEEEARKKGNQDWAVSKIKEHIEKREIGDAEKLLRQVVSKGILPESSDAVRQLSVLIQEEALRAKEREREELIRIDSQDRRIDETRVAMRSGDFAQATLLLDQAITSGLLSDQEERVRDLRAAIEQESRLADVRELEKEQRRQVAARSLDRVASLLKSGDIAGASRSLDRAVLQKELDETDPSVIALRDEIRREKVQREERENQQKRKLEKARTEARAAFGRGDFPATLEIARQTLGEFGSDRELQDLIRRAEAAVETEQIEKHNRDDLLARIQEHLETGHLDAARLLLDKSLKNNTLTQSDPQVAALASKLKTLSEQEKRKRDEIEQARSRLLDMLKKRSFERTITEGQSFLDRYGFSEEIAELVKQAEVANSAQQATEKRQQAELETVRGLLSESHAKQAKQVLEQAIAQGVLESTPDVKRLLKQADAELRKQEKERRSTTQAAIPELREAQAPKAHRWGVPLTIGAVIVVAAGSYAAYRVMHKPPPPPPSREVETKLLEQAQESINASPHEYKNAQSLLNQILNSPSGPSKPKQVANELLPGVDAKVKQEDALIAEGNDALQSRDCQSALTLFKDVVAINGDSLAEATDGLRKANDPSNCTVVVDQKKVVQDDLEEADRDFRENDLGRAKFFLEEVRKNPAASAEDLSVANKKIKMIDGKLGIARNLTAADQAFNSNDLEHARNLYSLVLGSPAADPSERDRAKSQVKAIDRLLAKGAGSGGGSAGAGGAGSGGTTTGGAGTGAAGSGGTTTGGAGTGAAGSGGTTTGGAGTGAAGSGGTTAGGGRAGGAGSGGTTTGSGGTGGAGSGGTTTGGSGAGGTGGGGTTTGSAGAGGTGSGGTTTSGAGSGGAGGGGTTTSGAGAGGAGSGGVSFDPHSDDERAIKDLIEVQLSNAFQRRDIKAIQNLWPSPYSNKTDLESFKQVFGASREFSRNCKIERIEFIGSDEARVIGSYSGEQTPTNGKPAPKSGSFDIRVVRQNGQHWIIKDIGW